MKKCIVCECANIIYYNPPKERPPIKCPDCGRDTRQYITLRTDDKRVDSLVEKYRKRKGGEADREGFIDYDNPNGQDGRSGGDDVRDVYERSGVDNRKEQEELVKHESRSNHEAGGGHGEYRVVSESNNYSIVIPESGGVIGRTAIGGEELAHNQRISREHMKVIPAKRAEGIMIEDISTNGTYINGRRLEKNKSEFAVIGSTITMGREAFIIERNQVLEGRDE